MINFQNISGAFGIAAVLGIIALVVYAVVWALKSNVFKTLSPLLGVFKSLLASMGAHPISWIAAIAGIVTAAIGGYVAYKLFQHFRDQKEVVKEMKKINESKTIDEKDKYSQAEIDAIDPLSEGYNVDILTKKTKVLDQGDRIPSGVTSADWVSYRTKLVELNEECDFARSQRKAYDESNYPTDEGKKSRLDDEAKADGVRNAWYEKGYDMIRPI